MAFSWMVCEFFKSLLSGYSCSIYSCSNRRQLYARTLYTHTTRALQTYNYTQIWSYVLLEITGTKYGTVSDRHITFPLWFHSREAAHLILGIQPRCENPHRAVLERGWWTLHRASLTNRATARSHMVCELYLFKVGLQNLLFSGISGLDLKDVLVGHL
jgi:hypothetical protein